MTDQPNFVDAAKAQRAREVARQKALSRPPRPLRATNDTALGKWLDKLVAEQAGEVRDTPDGDRDNQLNRSAFRVGRHIHLGIDRIDAENELFEAAALNGFVSDEGSGYVMRKIRRSISEGEREPADRPELEADKTIRRIDAEKTTRNGATPKPPPKDDDGARSVRLRSFANVKLTVPQWVWEYNGVGRIQLGTLSIFAGRPAAGKSTAVRWFAARISRGELPGVWFDTPMKVAVLMSEEQLDAVVAPGLVAAGANLSNIYYPEFRYDGTESMMMSQTDEARLTEELLDKQVAALFIDPIMNTFGSKTDINRNNEVRAVLAPFTRIASTINGIVVGVTHLRKTDAQNVLTGINGSSAFGEVPRAVFGFAPTENGDHVMEQVKNSAGPVNLKVEYRLPVEALVASDGQPIELPRFDIIGDTDVSIADINSDETETTSIAVAISWLEMYLLENQPAPSAQVKRDAKQSGDISDRTLKRASKKLNVVVRPASVPGKPRITVWSLPVEG